MVSFLLSIHPKITCSSFCENSSIRFAMKDSEQEHDASGSMGLAKGAGQTSVTSQNGGPRRPNGLFCDR